MTKHEHPATHDERALDPHEKWGQGTDASHPVSALDAVDAETPTVDTMADEPDYVGDDVLTDTAQRLRRTSGTDAHAGMKRRADEAIRDDDATAANDDLVPLA